MSLSGCARSGQTLSVFMWSEYIDPELVERFEKETGLKVVLDTYENTETMMSKMASAGGPVRRGGDVRPRGAHHDQAGQAARPWTCRRSPTPATSWPASAGPAYDPEGRYSLPYQWGTMGLVYRTDKLPDFEASWAVVLDPGPSPARWCCWTPCAT